MFPDVVLIATLTLFQCAPSCSRLARLRTMLLLRALLDTVGAVRGDLEHSIDVVRKMFPLLEKGVPQGTVTSDRLSTPASARTSVFIERQLGIHQRLWSMSEGYTTHDSRTVRSVSVSELDEMYDIVSEACSTNLFDLRTSSDVVDVHEKGSDDNTERQHEQTSPLWHDAELREHAVDSSLHELKSMSGLSTVDAGRLPVHRRLLLDAIIEGVTAAELRYLFSRLPLRLQDVWRKTSVAAK